MTGIEREYVPVELQCLHAGVGVGADIRSIIHCISIVIDTLPGPVSVAITVTSISISITGTILTTGISITTTASSAGSDAYMTLLNSECLVVVSVNKPRIELDRRIICCNSMVILILVLIRHTEIVVKFRIARLVGDRLQEEMKGLVVLLQIAICIADVT